MDFLNHMEGGVVFYQVFLLSPLQRTATHLRNFKRLCEFEEIEISRQRCRGDFEKQGGKLLRLMPGFCPRILASVQLLQVSLPVLRKIPTSN
jgi:hypothetical protein